MTLEETIAQIYISAFKELQKYIRQSNNPAKRNYWIAVARSMNKKIDKKVKELIETKFYPEYSKQMEEVEKMLTEGGIPEGFGVTYYGAVEKVAENLTQNIDKLKVIVGRRTQDFWREAQLIETGEKWATGASWKTMKNKLVQRIKDAGYLDFVDRSGKKWDLDSYASMVARTVTKQAAAAATVDACGRHEHDLVQVSSHGTDCPICKPLEGQIFSLSGNNPKYPKWEYQIPAHPNCKHVITPYVELEDVKKEAIETMEKLKQTQEVPQTPTPQTGGGILKKPSPETPRRDHLRGLSEEDKVLVTLKDAQDSGIKLTKAEAEEINADIEWWSHNGYEQVRDYQRFGGGWFSSRSVAKKVEKRAEAIERYIKFAPKYKKTVIYRGVGLHGKGNPLEIFKIGDIIDQQGTSSWTSDKDVALSFTLKCDQNGVLFILKENQTGVSINHLSAFGSEESEILMSKDARYRVVDVKTVKRHTEVILEEVFSE